MVYEGYFSWNSGMKRSYFGYLKKGYRLIKLEKIVCDIG